MHHITRFDYFSLSKSERRSTMESIQPRLDYVNRIRAHRHYFHEVLLGLHQRLQAHGLGPPRSWAPFLSIGSVQLTIEVKSIWNTRGVSWVTEEPVRVAGVTHRVSHLCYFLPMSVFCVTVVYRCAVWYCGCQYYGVREFSLESSDTLMPVLYRYNLLLRGEIVRSPYEFTQYIVRII